MKLPAVVSFLLLSTMSNQALADPSVTGTPQGSVYSLTARNTEQAAYSCHSDFSIVHTDFGVTTRSPISLDYFVKPNWTGVVTSSSTAWAAPIQLVDLTTRCTRVAGGGDPSKQPQATLGPNGCTDSGIAAYCWVVSADGVGRLLTIPLQGPDSALGMVPVVDCNYTEVQDPALKNYRERTCHGMSFNTVGELVESATPRQQGGKCGITLRQFACSP